MKNSWARGIFDKFFRVYFKAEVARQCEQHLILPRLVREKILLKFRPTFHLITIKNLSFGYWQWKFMSLFIIGTLLVVTDHLSRQHGVNRHLSISFQFSSSFKILLCSMGIFWCSNPHAPVVQKIANLWGPILKNSTSSPWKLQKTTSSANFCATGAIGLSCLLFQILFSLYFIIIYYIIFI